MADDALFADDVDELSDLKAKYDRSENNFKLLEKLASAAVLDYENLQLKYEQNQQQYEQLRERLMDTEEKLASLQSVLEPACNEFNSLNDQLQVEKACRTEAEKFASQKHKENSKLKRQSQMLLDKLNTHNVADIQSTLEMITDVEESSEDTTDNNNSVQQSHLLKEKISLLEKDIKELESKLHQSETQRAASVKAESDVKKKCSRLEAELLSVCKRLEDHEQSMRTFAQASHRAFGEFSELKDKYEEQMKLTSAAELFAHKMFRDNEALKRQSTVLMDKDVLGDARLMKALMEIEDLTRQLESVKQENKSRIESFEKALSSDENTKKMNDLEIELQLMSSEVARLQRALDDTEEWKEKLNKENENLRTKIDDIMRPPPPPPPPPCLLLPCITSTKLVINKQPTSDEIVKGSDRVASRPARNAPNADVNGALMGEMKDMMKRIETGNFLKPGGTVRNKPSNARPLLAESPMNELQKLLNKMGKRSDEEDLKLVSPSSLIGRQSTSSNPTPSQSRTFKALAAQNSTVMPPSPTSRDQLTSPSLARNSTSAPLRQSSAVGQEASRISASVQPEQALRGSTAAAAVPTVNRSSSQSGPPPVTLPKPTRSNSQRASNTSSTTVVPNGTLPPVDENKIINRSSTRQSSASETPDLNTNL